ncbi:hypothetical protein K501DRAFT_226015, partial [Backusella circina FSU 941]
MSSRVLRLPSITTRKPQLAAPTTTQSHNNNNNKNDYPLSDKIGQRVSVPSMNLTGTLRYVGQIDSKKGVWAGIELSDAQGKNDGSAQGVRYFTCPTDCGIFIGVGKVVLLASSLLPPPPPTVVKPSTSTRRSNLPLIPHASSSSSNSSSNNSKASKTMLKRPGSRTPSQSTTAITKKPSKTLTHKPSKTQLTHKPSKTTLTKRSHHLRVSSVPSESTPSPSATPPPPPVVQANSTITSHHQQTTSPIQTIHTTNNTTTTTTLTKRDSLKMTTSPTNKRESVRSSYTSTATPPPAPPSPPIQYEEEMQLLKKQLDDAHDELDKMKREKGLLLTQMKGKETAWERLVSSKESLSLQVEEKHEQQMRTQRELDQLRLSMEQLEADLADRDASIAKNIRNDEKQTQDQRRIERLETLVRELQHQIQVDTERHAQAGREHAGMLDQVRREVTNGESMTAALEKECADLRRAGLEAIAAYEQSVMQINDQHQVQLQERDEQMRQLHAIIAELKRKQRILFDDEEAEDEDNVDIDALLHQRAANNSEADQRHRLEEQLELTMAELDHERLIIKSQVNEMEQLKAEAVQLRQQKASLEERYMGLQADLERELQDKKRLIEEADAAFEAQARAEDEHYQIKLEKMAIEKELAYYKEEENLTHQNHHNEDEEEKDLMKKEKHELIKMNKQLEKDCIKLMDDMLILEKQMEQSGGDGDLQHKIQQLEKENQHHRHSLSQLELDKKTQVSQLSRDLAELESLVENKVLEEGDLEEKLEREKRRVVELERELKKYKHTPLSPTTTTTVTEDEDEQQKQGLLYCEFCDETGHDLIQCKSYRSDDDDNEETNRLYCENCDDYGLHITDDCPNQDETF